MNEAQTRNKSSSRSACTSSTFPGFCIYQKKSGVIAAKRKALDSWSYYHRYTYDYDGEDEKCFLSSWNDLSRFVFSQAQQQQSELVWSYVVFNIKYIMPSPSHPIFVVCVLTPNSTFLSQHTYLEIEKELHVLCYCISDNCWIKGYK